MKTAQPPTECIALAYGRGRLTIPAPPSLADWQVLHLRPELPLPGPEQAFREACRRPIDSRPLRDAVRATDRVVVVTADGTRPVPNRQLLPWLLRELPVPPSQVTVLLGNGTHRANTPAEIRGMFGDDLPGGVQILNHDAFASDANQLVGRLASGTEVWVDRQYLAADCRIVLGFIEPHFFAGFSGGAKGIVPGLAGIDTIRAIHRAELIGHPDSTWLVLDRNPIRREIAEMVRLCAPEFLINVTLNQSKEITGLYAGHYETAHRQGCERVAETAAVRLPRRCPLVLTSNSGYPLDQNLYQTVKGISAAALAVEPGGTILVASECSDGIPAGGEFARLMQVGSTPRQVLDWVEAQPQTVLDQWQAQVLATILLKARVRVYSSLPADAVRRCQMEPIPDLAADVRACLAGLGPRPPVAVLPEGPLTVPQICG